jgi:hypothetical protein
MEHVDLAALVANLAALLTKRAWAVAPLEYRLCRQSKRISDTHLRRRAEIIDIRQLPRLVGWRSKF